MSSKIGHVVFFSLDAAKFAEHVAPNADRLVRGIRENVPGLIEFNFAPSSTDLYEGYVDCSGGYTHCVVTKHKDRAALKTYAEHPDHKLFVEALKPCFVRPVLRMDFEIKE